jgi:hypothetical protein
MEAWKDLRNETYKGKVNRYVDLQGNKKRQNWASSGSSKFVRTNFKFW